MGNDRYDPDERFSLDMEPEEVLAAIFEGAGTEGNEVEMEPAGDEP